MMIQMIKRKRDIITADDDLEPIYTIKKFPVYMGVTDDDESKDLYADQKWMISKGSGMIQLGELVPLNILYAKSHNSGIGKVWRRHNEQFADFIYKYRGEKGVVEIGGGNGILNAIYNEKYISGEWLIVEPSLLESYSGCNAKYLHAFWNSDIDLSEVAYDTLIHAHCMEHQFDINSFMQCNSDVLHIGEKMIFSLPNMRILLEKYYPYALNFEHTYLITEEYIDLLLSCYGFDVLEKKYFEDHSIFYSTQKSGIKTGFNMKEAKSLKESSMQLFKKYIDYYMTSINRINKEMEVYRNGNIYVFGAHVNTQLLISFGLNTEHIKYVLDNDKLKQGHRLYGTKFSVRSPKILKNEENPLVLLVMGAYNHEIKEDILENINNTVNFIYL